MKDQLFILKAPFTDGPFDWYCNDCATLEGALLANSHWNDRIDVRRIGFDRPRREVIELVGEENQGLPMLVMDIQGAPGDAVRIGKFAVLKDIRAIGRALAHRHGGVGPHP